MGNFIFSPVILAKNIGWVMIGVVIASAVWSLAIWRESIPAWAWWLGAVVFGFYVLFAAAALFILSRATY